jgi:hypothetical protein
MKQAPEQYRPRGGKTVIKLSKSSKRLAILTKNKVQSNILKKSMVVAETAHLINTDARLRLASQMSGNKSD